MCKPDSLQGLISHASRYKNITYIAEPTVNWIDDYLDWLKPTSGSIRCCSTYKSNNATFCDGNSEGDANKCQSCEVYRNEAEIPKSDSFLKYIKYFLKQTPSEKCIKAGSAMYGSAIKLGLDGDEFENDNYKNRNVKSVESSHFMTYHTVLSKSIDFINAMLSANRLATLITDTINNNTSGEKYEVFPYRLVLKTNF